MVELSAAGTGDWVRSATEVSFIEANGLCGTWRWDFVGGVLSWSRGFYRLLGLDPAAIQPSISAWQDLLHPEDRRNLSDPASLIVQGSVNERTVRLLRADGSLRYIRSFSEQYYDRHGKPNELRGISFDVTELELLRAQAREAKSLLEATVLATGVSTWSFSLGDKRVLDETALERSLHWVASSDVPQFIAAVRDAIMKASPFAISHRRATGERVVTNVSLVRNSRGVPEGLVGVTQTDASSVGPFPTQSKMQPWAVRAARAAVGWTASALAEAAGVSFSTVRRSEDDKTTGLRDETWNLLKAALERGGAVFGGTPGGRLTVGFSQSDKPDALE